ncbi:MAG: hypothetical protein LBC59_05420 [Chitinispirillales bacterium]|jgi:glutamine synthetase|nr:hypothetical protein [Chitinispirillales bacterium]
MSTSRSDIAQSIASVEREPYAREAPNPKPSSQPPLRGDTAVNETALELLNLFGRKAENIYSVCGIEQEFFLIDRGWYNKRTDLMLTGRTLVGAPSPKTKYWRFEGQCGGLINERVLHYVNDVIAEETKHSVSNVGVSSDVYSNGAAPNQYWFVQKREASDITICSNLLLTDIMKKVALRHNLVYLPHEKPFAGVNGSGKHLYWSLSDDKSGNLFKPGDTIDENLLFLTLLVSVIHAVYRHGDLLRAASASAGNERQLGVNEAPPVVISVSLGEQLTKIITMIEAGKTEKGKKRDFADLGAGLLPKFTYDATDRGRVSPVVFNGDRFELRTLGGATDVSTAVTIVNTIVVDSMKTVCERIKKELNKNKGDKDADPQLSAAVLNVLSAVIKESKSVLFDGDNNSNEWVKEAQSRGLPNVTSTPEALKAFITPKAVELFGRHKVFSEAELKDLYNARIDQYNKTIDIEIKALTDIVNTQVLPAAYNYQTDIASGLEVLRVLADDMTIEMTDGALEDRKEMFEKLTADIYYLRKNLKELTAMADKARGMGAPERAAYLHKEIKPQMNRVRKHVDALEGCMPDESWPLPKYKEMLFIL